ncbi:hypothetical protein VTN77DRAFT_2532 [Rasamsonia byssochlamydoides]|uniref:uncharacterized protein n=1 Tax=Rasamsonia byssochlamydoides TaxID=89139 RepID=UPI003744003D
MPAPSLRAICTRTAIQNAKNLMDIGNIPYSLARPFLLKIESPAQLRTLELQSPHIMQDDRELWIEFIKRDVPQWDRFELPETSDCWYDIYRDLIEQVQREVDEDAARLKMAVDQINSKRASSGSKFLVDRQIARLPKPRPTRIQRYAAHDRKMGGIAPTFTASYNADGEKIWSLEAPKLRPERSRSEPKKSNIFTTKRNKALAVPTHRLKSEVSQIKQVPRWLIEEHKQSPPVQTQVPKRPAAASSPKSLPSVPFASSSARTSSSSAALGSSPASSSLQARQDRLRALTSKHSTSASTIPAPSSSSTASPRAKPAAEAGTETRSASSPKRPDETKHQQSSDAEPESSRPSAQPPSQSVDRTIKSSPPPAATSRPPPAAAIIRKRPAPSVFIQPKRKKI